MLRFLRIRHLAVIDAAEVEFAPGFNVLTGETGAGKSILVEAVGLLLGGRASGDLVRYGNDGAPAFTIRRMDDGRAPPGAHYYTGLTFALDLPTASDPPQAFDEMARVATLFATTLGGQLVDDNRRPLSDAGLGSIRRSVEKLSQDMQAHGIPAGSVLARRLFSQ